MARCTYLQDRIKHYLHVSGARFICNVNNLTYIYLTRRKTDKHQVFFLVDYCVTSSSRSKCSEGVIGAENRLLTRFGRQRSRARIYIYGSIGRGLLLATAGSRMLLMTDDGGWGLLMTVDAFWWMLRAIRCCWRFLMVENGCWVLQLAVNNAADSSSLLLIVDKGWWLLLNPLPSQWTLKSTFKNLLLIFFGVSGWA